MNLFQIDFVVTTRGYFAMQSFRIYFDSLYLKMRHFLPPQVDLSLFRAPSVMQQSVLGFSKPIRRNLILVK